MFDNENAAVLWTNSISFVSCDRPTKNNWIDFHEICLRYNLQKTESTTKFISDLIYARDDIKQL